MSPIRVLSLGAGVQSTTVLLMALQGELPKLDAAVFADTGWEPSKVYAHLEWLKGRAERAGVPLLVRKHGHIKQDALGAQRTVAHGRFASMPFHVRNPDGSGGMIRRQCTREYKIGVVEQAVRRELLGLDKGAHAPLGAVEQWFGISCDEMRRVRMSRKGWVRFHYPLIEKGMTRQDCLDWCEANGHGEPPRSACIGCPYRSAASWRRMQLEEPEEFEDACRFDEAMRTPHRLRGQAFLHRSLRPLREVDFRSDVEQGQGLLFDGDGCGTGMCGV